MTQVLQSALKGALAIVSKAVAGKSSLPVLSNILFRATTDGKLILSATNLEIGLVVPVAAKVEEEWAGTFPAKLVSDIVSNLPNDRIDLSFDEKTVTLTIKCQGSTSKIKGIEAEEFPIILNGDEAKPLLTVAGDLLRSALQRVVFAAATDDSRPVLAGVNFANGEIAATDGYRLTAHALPFEGACIVPARALATLTGIIGEGDVSASLTQHGGRVIFASDSYVLTSRLIDGKFPDYKRIIPSQHTTRAIFDVAELLKAVKLASFFAASSQNIVKLSFEGEGVTISANAAEVGDNTGFVAGTVAGNIGDESKIAVNVAFLAEALGAMKTQHVAIEMNSPRSPLVLKPVGDEGYTSLLMPMTIRG